MSLCRICSSGDLVDVMIGSIRLVHCNSCDMFYLKNMPTQEELDLYYQTNYQITSEDIIKTEKRRIFRIIEQVKLISEIKEFKLPPAKLLDIGCDKGFFMDEARRWGYKVSGVEPSESARSYCSNIGLETNEGLNQVNEKFDIITMWHSLEHHLEPTQFLDSIKLLLAENSYLFIRVPAFDNFWRKVFGSRWIWFQPQNHYFHYTMKSLDNMLNTAGFDVIKIEKRKPNNRYTKRVYIIINRILNEKIPLKERLARIYEDITGVELFAIAKLK